MIIKRILRKIFRRRIIKNFKKYIVGNTYGHALLYYKTDHYFMSGLLSSPSHTNEWESYQIARILNEIGYIVDIIGTTATESEIEKIENKYKLFVGIGAGDSGKHYSGICKRTPNALKILYALGPEPEYSNKLTSERHDYFRSRHPDSKVITRRLIEKVDISEAIAYTDAIITCCNNWGIESYKKFEVPIQRVWLSSNPAVDINLSDIIKKDQKKFLYFGGNGNITKGLDLAIEAFSKVPELELFIGAPSSESDFNEVMLPVVNKYPNIHFLGFLDVKGNEFNRIADMCAYVILPSSSEGSATSVTTAMRKALVPIVTLEAGVDIGNFGFMLKSIRISEIASELDKISKISRDEYLIRSFNTYISSYNYTQSEFTKTFKIALLKVLFENNTHAK